MWMLSLYLHVNKKSDDIMRLMMMHEFFDCSYNVHILLAVKSRSGLYDCIGWSARSFYSPAHKKLFKGKPANFDKEHNYL